MASWEDYLQNQINIDGVQATWNVLPSSRPDSQKLVVPNAIFFTPLKEKPEDAPQQPALEYDPVLCQKSTCKAILNPLWFKATTLPPIFLFVADTCVTEDELVALKESLKNAVSMLPADAFVGLITFGRHVELHEMNSKGMYRSYVFKGTKEVDQK
uniref:Protein transport protein SEC23 n=1 Tax=Panagrolaimus sp. ES5 TaxID=591445 RepID=A0AC34GDT0_9BILA